MESATKNKGSYFSAYAHVYEHYLDDAAFLWLLRNNATTQPHFRPNDLCELDNRLQLQLNGLLTAPEESWVLCEKALELQQPGEVFVASVLAFRSLDVTKIQIVVEAGLKNPLCFNALVSAMAWLSGRFVHSWIKKFLTSKDLDHKYLALAVCSARREDPREYLTTILQRPDCINHERLYSRAIRLVGELKRFDLLPAVRLSHNAENKTLKFWSLWTQVLLGDRAQSLNLHEWVMKANPLQAHAIELCFRSLPVATSRDWLSQLAKENSNQRQVIRATSVLGDPQAIDWLIAKMQMPVFTRLAGEAFTHITGIDLVDNKLAFVDIPNLEEQMPDDGEQEPDLILSEDVNLPFPDPNKVAAVWQKYQHKFAFGQRYFLGQMVAKQDSANQFFLRQFSIANQRQRASAALELALNDASHFLLNHAAKGIDDE